MLTIQLSNNRFAFRVGHAWFWPTVEELVRYGGGVAGVIDVLRAFEVSSTSQAYPLLDDVVSGVRLPKEPTLMTLILRNVTVQQRSTGQVAKVAVTCICAVRVDAGTSADGRLILPIPGRTVAIVRAVDSSKRVLPGARISLLEDELGVTLTMATVDGELGLLWQDGFHGVLLVRENPGESAAFQNIEINEQSPEFVEVTLMRRPDEPV